MIRNVIPENKKQLNLTLLTSGIYLVKSMQNSAVTTSKIIVQH
jgi:hypothetical protein